MSEKPCDVCSETHTGYAADPCACSCHAPAPPAPERICEYCGCEFVPEDKHHIAYAEDCICRMALLEKVAAKDAELIACRGAKAAWKARADKAEADNARLRAELAEDVRDAETLLMGELKIWKADAEKFRAALEKLLAAYIAERGECSCGRDWCCVCIAREALEGKP